MEYPEDEIRLGEAALLLASTEYPTLDIVGDLARLDVLAAPKVYSRRVRNNEYREPEPVPFRRGNLFRVIIRFVSKL